MESPKKYTVACSERVRVEEQAERALEAGLGAKRHRSRGGARTQYESIESLLDGEQVVARTLKGRIVA